MSILKMLGAETEEQGVETLTKFMTFLSDVRAATGTDGMETALAAVRSAVTFGKDVEAATGKKGAEVVALFGELKASADGAAATKADLDKVLAAIGETTADAAVGSIATAKTARDELLPQAQATLAKQEKDAEDQAKAAQQAEADSLLKTLQTENRITPAQEKDLWPSLSLESKRAFAKTAAPINGKSLTEATESSVAGATTFNGKTYAELSYSEKAQLKRSNPELFKQLHAASEEAA